MAFCSGFTTKLVNRMLANEQYPDNIRTALNQIASRLEIQYGSNSAFQYQVELSDCSGNVKHCHLYLTVLKGSIFTHLWNSWARIDDEYALEFEDKCSENAPAIFSVWTFKHLDPLNAKVGSCHCDWNLIKYIMVGLRITSIGLQVFGKLFGRLILSLPNFVNYGEYISPMPATFMSVSSRRFSVP